MSVSFLQQPVQFLKGVGPRRADVLKEEGIVTVADLLSLFPRRYLDRTTVQAIRELKAGSDPVTVMGERWSSRL